MGTKLLEFNCNVKGCQNHGNNKIVVETMENKPFYFCDEHFCKTTLTVKINNRKQSEIDINTIEK